MFFKNFSLLFIKKSIKILRFNILKFYKIKKKFCTNALFLKFKYFY